MYSCSDAFHEAVQNGNEQKALLIFSDCVFTDDDISVEDGIEFRDYFNTDEDLSIGQANSNEISFTLFNDDRVLNSYAFGDFTATLGVQTGSTTYTRNETENVRVVAGNSTWIGNSTSPYLKRNGTAVANGPDWPVESLLCYDGKVYAFGDRSARYAVYNASTGASISETVNSVARNIAAKHWGGKGMYYHENGTSGLDSTILEEWENGVKKTYEFVPLGHFTAERPNQPDQIQFSMTCYDYMCKFDVDMPPASELDGGVSYPLTFRNLLIHMCNHVGVEYELGTFLNQNATISEEPEDFASATMRDVVKWIAEAAGSNARINRDGKLILDWIRNTESQYLYYSESQYTDYSPYWYQTKRVTKLYNRDSQGGEDATIGTGDEGYLILDNPLLKGVT